MLNIGINSFCKHRDWPPVSPNRKTRRLCFLKMVEKEKDDEFLTCILFL